jgi:hypothetical protein
MAPAQIDRRRPTWDPSAFDALASGGSLTVRTAKSGARAQFVSGEWPVGWLWLGSRPTVALTQALMHG